jgi:hypothetical protein
MVKRMAAVITGGASIGFALLHGMGALGGFPWSGLLRIV